MKKIILAAAVFAASSAAIAQTAAPAVPASPHTFTGNLTVATDYRFRGISQTFKHPTVQGGFDYSHSSGFYAGNWNSNVSGNSFPSGAGLEMDFYTGFKFEPAKDLNADIGILYYYYPGAKYAGNNEKYHNTEIYFGGSYKWFSAKYNYAVSDLFGLNSTTSGTTNGSSRGSGYLDLNANFEIADKTVLGLHVGRQWVKNYSAFNYTDYKIGVTRDFGFASVGLAYVNTNTDNAFYSASGGGETKQLSRGAAVLSVSKTF